MTVCVAEKLYHQSIMTHYCMISDRPETASACHTQRNTAATSTISRNKLNHIQNQKRNTTEDNNSNNNNNNININNNINDYNTIFKNINIITEKKLVSYIHTELLCYY